MLESIGREVRDRAQICWPMEVQLRRMVLVASLPFLIGAHDCTGGRTVGEPASVRSCGAICDELAGAWSVTVAPPTSVMVACSDPRADGTAVAFPSEEIGLGEVQVAPSSSGPLIEFGSARSSLWITGTLDPGTLGVRFDLQDSQGKGIRCSDILHKFTNPGGSEGWVTQTACDSGAAGTTVCRLDPPVKVTLLVQRILMEGAPSP